MIKQKKLKINQKAPTFTLFDQDGNEHSLSDYKGKWVLLYFYPQDDTPGCTKEVCAIRDNFPDFNKLKLTPLGISVDPVESHKKFATKYKLPFTILSDESKGVVKKYGVWAKKKFIGREYMGTLRTSFLINTTGKIVKIYEKVKPELHASEVLEDMKTLLTPD